LDFIAIIVSVVCVLSGLVTFVLYGVDKAKARRGAWRISERTLLLWAFFLGGIGAAAGMAFFRHKTRHLKFRLLVPVFCVTEILVLLKVWGII